MLKLPILQKKKIYERVRKINSNVTPMRRNWMSLKSHSMYHVARLCSARECLSLNRNEPNLFSPMKLHQTRFSRCLQKTLINLSDIHLPRVFQMMIKIKKTKSTKTQNHILPHLFLVYAREQQFSHKIQRFHRGSEKLAVFTYM